MKLYVKSNNGTKKYISSKAKTRRQLLLSLGNEYFDLDNGSFSINDVYAEPDSDRTAAGMAAGGVIGVGGGVPGVLIGSLIGSLIGNKLGQDDQQLVDTFNNSKITGTTDGC